MAGCGGVTGGCVCPGFNSCLFCYGQTGAGKTYTIIGGGIDGPSDNPSGNGIVQNSLAEVFDRLEQRKQASDVGSSFQIKMSYYEIYQEQIYDLLNRSDYLQPLQMYQQDARNVLIKNLTEVSISQMSEAMDLLKLGTKKRHIGETKMNLTSSRSHTILSLGLLQRTSCTAKESKMHIVDLAGSENMKKTQATAIRQQEACKINQSLLVLGNVIEKLVEQDRLNKYIHIPYRCSKLTRILQDSLGGNSKTFIICNITCDEQ